MKTSVTLSLPKSRPLALFALALLLSVSACRCKDKKKPCTDPSNPDCENYDPCYTIKPAKADFGIYEVISDVGMRAKHLLDETDTILAINGAYFKPKSKQDKVTWILGSETVEQEDLYRRGYPSGWIDVTMIAEVNPHKCLQEHELRDTLTRQFYVYKYGTGSYDTTDYKDWIWWGTWEGANTDAPDDKFTISWGYINGFTSSWIHFTGLPKGLPKQNPFYQGQGSGQVAFDITVFAGYKAVLLGSKGNGMPGGFLLDGIGRYRNGVLEIEYKYNNKAYQKWLNGGQGESEPIEWVSKKWIGHKISNQVITQ